MKIVITILLILSVVSCAPKAVVKENAELSVTPPPPSEELKPSESTQKPAEPKAEPKAEAEPKETKKAEAVRIEREAEEKYVILNFDGADIETVISTIGELLNINYILTSGVTGKVTIQSYKKFPVKDLFQIFQTILELNGLTAVQDGSLYRIVPIDTAKQQPVRVEEGKELKLQLDSSFITQIVPLEYVKASDVANIIRNLMPRGADIVVYEPTNLLIITAPHSALLKFMKILEAVDVPPTERETIKTFVYYVEHREAKKLAELLKSLYAEKKPGVTPKIPTPTPRTAAPRTPPAVPTTATIEGELPGELEGEVTFAAYEDINALVIKTTPRGYLILLETLKKLDVPAKQVLIEVLIADVTLKDEETLGIEWLMKERGRAFGTELHGVGGFTTGGVSLDTSGEGKGFITTYPTGAFANIFDPARFNALISAFVSTEKFNVLASPHILAMDNKEANIQIGDEVPTATGLIQQPATAGAGTTLVTTGQIQYKTVGILLNVKPHITEKDRVTLDITQEVSELGASIPVAGQNFQGFVTRKAKTTAVVQSGHTLVIGGLMRETKSQGRSGIPLLSKIPILGYLFSKTTDTYRKTELLVMVTPHVISNQDEADALTKEFQNRIKTIKGLEKVKEDKKGGKSYGKEKDSSNSMQKH
ncbi:MAG: secretin N-terminal domain-containing protein [Nitrospirota bacterium]